MDLRFSSFWFGLFCMEDGGDFALAFFAADADAAFAGLLALRFAVEVCWAWDVFALGWEAERGSFGVVVGVDTPLSDPLRVNLVGVAVWVDGDGRCEGWGIRLRAVFCVKRLVGVSLRSSDGEEAEPLGCGWTKSV